MFFFFTSISHPVPFTSVKQPGNKNLRLSKGRFERRILKFKVKERDLSHESLDQIIHCGVISMELFLFSKVFLKVSNWVFLNKTRSKQNVLVSKKGKSHGYVLLEKVDSNFIGRER